ncbi:hypothetical protein FB107DRAFT_223404 [Schizophyllum commune]
MKRGHSPETSKAKKIKTSVGLSAQENEETGGWTKVEKRKQKKARKAEVQMDKQPRFLYNNAEIAKRNHAMGIDDIRELVLHVTADAPPPNWVRIDNALQIQKVVVLLVPGITREVLSLPPPPTSATTNPNFPISIPLRPPPDAPTIGLPFVSSTFSHAVPTRAPGDANRMHSVLSTFFNGPVSEQERRQRMAARAASEASTANDPSRYLITLEQMIENDYPVPSYMADTFQKPDDAWVEIPKEESSILDDFQARRQPKQRSVYALDCEMCLTEDGQELARVCMIDFTTDKVMYDRLVKPAKPILDYLTKWSGITEESLAPVTTTLAEVQADIVRFLTPKDAPMPILMGHSLENDLRALKICHPLCIDTALMYHHPRGRPLKPGLAWLTRKWCAREIQARGEGGHDPEEDARACVELLHRKLEYGPDYGTFRVDWESIFERMSRSTKFNAGGAGRAAVIDHGNPALHGAKASTAVACTTDEEVLSGLLEAIPSHKFIYGRFTELADTLGWITARPEKGAPPSEEPPAFKPPPTQEAVNQALAALNTRLAAVHAALPPRTALVIFTGHEDPQRMVNLGRKRGAWEAAIRNGSDPAEKWTMEDMRQLEEAVEVAKRGLLFLGVKS